MSILASAPPERSYPEEGIVLRGVTWDYYDRTVEELDGTRVRVNFHQGIMEMMTVSNEHEAVKRTIARLIEMYSLQANVPVTGVGSVTCRRRDVEAGIEPDECYYVQTRPPRAGPRPLDLSVHPPPDLAVEVEVTRSVVPRLPIYGALGIPEVWRFDGERIHVLLRASDGTYQEAERGRAFPKLPMDVFTQFVQQGLGPAPHAQHEAVVAFRDWLGAHPD